MQKFSRSATFAAAGASLLLAGSAHADTIALNWYDSVGPWTNPVVGATDPSNNSLSTTDVFGEPGGSTAGWQNTPDIAPYDVAGGTYLQAGAIPAMSLKNTSGASTTATLTVDPTGTGLNGVPVLSSSGNWNSSSTANDPSLPTVMDHAYNSYLVANGGRTTELALNNIPYASYNIYVYMSNSQYQSGNLQLFEGGTAAGEQTPVYFSTGMNWVPLNSGGGYPDTNGYLQITSTDPNNPTLTGNSQAYIEFSNLTGATQYMDLVETGGGISALEIVQTPEPASLSLVAIGTGALQRRHRRQSQK